MLLAFRCALASPRVTAAAIEANEFPLHAGRHGVLAVPKVVAGASSWEGAVPEAVFLQRLLAAGG